MAKQSVRERERLIRSSADGFVMMECENIN